MSGAEPVTEALTVEIAGRGYEATRVGPGHWWLIGKRGARYRTHRRDDGLLFLVSYTAGKRSVFRPDPLGPIVLTDENGILRVVAAS